jgi:hypothetical protein
MQATTRQIAEAEIWLPLCKTQHEQTRNRKQNETKRARECSRKHNRHIAQKHAASPATNSHARHKATHKPQPLQAVVDAQPSAHRNGAFVANVVVVLHPNINPHSSKTSAENAAANTTDT